MVAAALLEPEAEAALLDLVTAGVAGSELREGRAVAAAAAAAAPTGLGPGRSAGRPLAPGVAAELGLAVDVGLAADRDDFPPKPKKPKVEAAFQGRPLPCRWSS